MCIYTSVFHVKETLLLKNNVYNERCICIGFILFNLIIQNYSNIHRAYRVYNLSIHEWIIPTIRG